MNSLRLPYPFYHGGISLIRYSVLVFLFGFLFEYLIVPFPRKPDEHLFIYEIICLFHISVAVLIYIVYFAIVSVFVRTDHWKRINELIAVFFLLLLIGSAEWSIRPIIYDNGGKMLLGSFIEELWHAQIFGGLIYLLVTLAHIKLNIKNQEIEAHPISNSAITSVNINTYNNSDDFKLHLGELICVRADGNYLEFYERSEIGTTKSIKRLTLQSLSNQLKDKTHIIKTHRSFMINPSFITHIDGNAQGYKLMMKGVDFEVPVSRKHLNDFKALVN